MDGKYNIVLGTPMGNEKGIIQFKTNGASLSGSVYAKGTTNQFYSGKVDGDNFQFSGEMRIMMMKIRYSAQGVVKGKNLTGIVKTMYGNFSVNGIKV